MPSAQSLKQIHRQLKFRIRWSLITIVLSNTLFCTLFLWTSLNSMNLTAQIWKDIFKEKLEKISTHLGAPERAGVDVVHRLIISPDGTIREAPVPALAGIRLNPSGFYGKVAELTEGKIALVLYPDLVDGTQRAHFVQRLAGDLVVLSMEPQELFIQAMASTVGLMITTKGVIRYADNPDVVGNVEPGGSLSFQEGRLFLLKTSPVTQMPDSNLVITQDITDQFSLAVILSLFLLLFFFLVNLRSFQAHRDFLRMEKEYQVLQGIFSDLAALMLPETLDLHGTDAVFFEKMERVFKNLHEADFTFEENKLSFSLLKKLTQDFLGVIKTMVESEARFQAVVLTAPDAIITLDHHGTIFSWNDAAEAIFGIPGDSAVGSSMDRLTVPGFPGLLECLTPGVCEDPDRHILCRSLESMGLRADGGQFPMEFSLSAWTTPTGDFITATIRDVSDRKKAEATIKKSLKEKETLIRELFHRTRNNMGSIIALLSLQSGYLQDEKIKAAFTEAQNRIRSMALVHQKLFDSGDLSHVNLKRYIGELVELLWDSHGVDRTRISWDLVLEDVSVLIDTAIPCGLILNELISNSLQHAFPAGEGCVTVELHQDPSGEILLRVADNGKGLDPGFDFRRQGKLGLNEILLMAESQLDAQVDFRSGMGVEFSLRFRDNLYQERV